MNASREAAIEAGLKTADLTSEERNRLYSRRIRRKVEKWMNLHVGELFDSMEDMHDQAANYLFKCSSTTARRWMRQAAAPGEKYVITEQAAGYVIMWREEWEASRRA